MTYLLDTHAFLWFVTNDAQLSAVAFGLISDPTNDILVSPASYWEVAIKVSMKKYPLKVPFETFIAEAIARHDFEILPIEVRHVAALVDLPFHHKDPFDRLIVAQAKVEGIDVISIDAVLDAYPIRRVW